MTELSPYRRVRADPADWFDSDEIERGRAYVRPIRRLGHVQSALSLALSLAFIVGDGGPRVLDALDVSGWALQLVVVVVVFLSLDLLIAPWFDAWRELVWDKRWEMSTQTWRGFVTDQVKTALLNPALMLLLLLPVWALVRTSDLWWAWGWLVLAGFTLLAGTLGPVVLAPIFNTYTPMEDQALRQRLLDVARTADLDVDEVLVADASRRTRAANAHVSGLGTTRRVVVFDTLLDWEPEHLEQIVGHELGHWHLKHLRRRVPVVVIAQGLALMFTALALQWDWVLDVAGVDTERDAAAAPVFLLAFSLGFKLSALVTSWLSRVDERAADIYALQLLGKPDDFAAAFRKLVEVNKAEIDPPWWKRITHTHPPLAERVAMAAVYEPK